MMLNIGQLLDDAKLIKRALDDYSDWFPHEEHPAELEAIDRIIAYFQERYVPPGEPGRYKETRGLTGWQPGDEPADESIRRIRGDVIESGVNIDTRFEGGTSWD